jgi:rRNA-processing protein FCF1
VHPAERDADTAIVDETRVTQGVQTVVVTADRGLRQRLDPGIHVAGPSWLLDRVERRATD